MISIFLDFCIFWPSPGLSKGRYPKTISKQQILYAIWFVMKSYIKKCD